jgi:hypothetical protein
MSVRFRRAAARVAEQKIKRNLIETEAWSDMEAFENPAEAECSMGTSSTTNTTLESNTSEDLSISDLFDTTHNIAKAAKSKKTYSKRKTINDDTNMQPKIIDFESPRDKERLRLEYCKRREARMVHSDRSMKLSQRVSYGMMKKSETSSKFSPVVACRLSFENCNAVTKKISCRQR